LPAVAVEPVDLDRAVFSLQVAQVELADTRLVQFQFQQEFLTQSQ
jgi:hypothetical protein